MRAVIRALRSSSGESSKQRWGRSLRFRRRRRCRCVRHHIDRRGLFILSAKESSHRSSVCRLIKYIDLKTSKKPRGGRVSWVGGEMKNSLLLTTRVETTTRINSCLQPGLGNKLCLIVSCREPISWRSHKPKQRGTWSRASLDEREVSVYRVVSFSTK